uniref:Nucleoporin NUP42 n=1 Tax=Lates calcarifer TaxID=8187 RepID=A0A4W6ECN3_LATCA
MTICNFFLQGRCRYGEKCWNEHPRGGNRGAGGGFGNRVWVNPNQQKGGYIQPSSFSSHGRSDWGRGGGGRRDNVKSSEFNFSSQNRFSALNSPSTFDRGGRGGAAGDEDDDKKLEIIQLDIDVWESSRQWWFSCYSPSKTLVSGFTDLSPEELRMEYYSTRASGDLQGYLNGVNQLLNQWRSRVQELKVMNPATRAALLAELNNPAPQSFSGGFGSVTSTGFGSSTSDFGSKVKSIFTVKTKTLSDHVGFGAPAQGQASSFSFAAPSGGFGSSAAPSSSTGFGSAIAAPTQPPSGFGSSSAPSASEFSFAASSTNKPAAASGFGAGSVGGASDSLFSPEDKLTPEELNQFKAKRFTLGQIPLKPPPADLLVL